jgi:hypothetical protein
MKRMSLLPHAAICGASAALSERFGAGRPAAMSKAFHALASGDSDASRLISLLSDIEKREIMTWKMPATVIIDGVTLEYRHADKELTVGFDSMGFYDDSAEAMCIGHLDFAWAPETSRHVFVADIKKSSYTTPDGVDSLQLHAYGWAYATLHDRPSYMRGLWIASESEWQWAPDPIVLSSAEGSTIWHRILLAANNPSTEYSTGPHCTSCWSRLHCPEYALPLATVDSWLAPVADGGVPTNEQAADILRKATAVKDVAELVIENLKAAIRHGGLTIEDRDGRRWLPVQCKGRHSVSMEKLRRGLGQNAEQYIRRGAPFEQFHWIKPK